jgi:hypothetical protein
MTTPNHKPRVYISGPMTGMPEDNFPAFEEAAKRWRSWGWDVSNPAENFGGRRDLARASYMRADMMMLATCDAIAMLPGWEKSRGAKAEYYMAHEIGLRVLNAADGTQMTNKPQPMLTLKKENDTSAPPDSVVEIGTDLKSTLPDSGTRRQFATGAVRDGATNKGRFDLLPYYGLEAVARHFEAGAIKYAPRNWEKGIPLHIYLDSGSRHGAKASANWIDEPHAEAAAWNYLCFLHTRRLIELGILPAELAHGMAQPFDPRPRGAQ